MPKPKALLPAEAARTLAHRFGPRADSLRQFMTKFGLRPMRVFLVWQKWTGAERGEGTDVEIARLEILPTPKVVNMDAVTLSPMSAGTLPEGTIRVDEISVTLTADQLTGRTLPRSHEDHIPEPYDFYWELYEDGRGDNPALRQKYRLASQVVRQAGKICWTVLLERVSEDATRTGASRYGAGT